ncbi:uncharacterized protein LOC108678400 [Hyalella azteca]|uniref:Uncharacterized protein LOC108678400 n=1 Tax=Hyalella azteca TaxID=294128 RepID=A0A8B7P8K3_HYAAZ|nr:uncharacterized protein LOC108678400 [Hyalella azteca]
MCRLHGSSSCTIAMLLVLMTSTLAVTLKRAERASGPAREDEFLSTLQQHTNETRSSLAHHIQNVAGVMKDTMTSPWVPGAGKQLFPGATPACLSCQVLVKALFQFLRSTTDTALFYKGLIAICQQLLFRQPGVCSGILNNEKVTNQ